MYTPLISASELQALLAGGQPCLVCACSFELRGVVFNAAPDAWLKI